MATSIISRILPHANDNDGDTPPITPAQIISFRRPLPRLRADVVPFDPTNPAHIRAWEGIWDFGVQSLKGGRA